MKHLKHIPFIHTLFCATVALTVAMLAASCTLEGDGSSDLSGFWHLESVDTLATGGHADLSGHRVFWAVQGDLLRVSDADAGGDSYFFRYTHQNDSLTLSEPRIDARTDGDPAVQNPSLLTPFGIQRITEHYIVESLKSSRMVIRSQELRLGFKKF